jgi:hypothetical protein
LETYKSFLQFACRCRNIVVYKDQAHHDCPSSFFAPFFEHCGHSLRRLEIFNAEVSSNFPSLLTNLLPNLQYLGLCDIYPDSDDPATPSVIALPCLHTLRLENYIDVWKAAWDVQNLQFLGVVHPDGNSYDVSFKPQPKHVQRLDLRGFFQQDHLGSMLCSNFPEIKSLAVTCGTFRFADGLPSCRFPLLVELFIEFHDPGDGRVVEDVRIMMRTFRNRQAFPLLASISIHGVGPSTLNIDPKDWQHWADDFFKAQY